MDKTFYINKIIGEYGENLKRQKTAIDRTLKTARLSPEFAALEKEIASLEIDLAKTEAGGGQSKAQSSRLASLTKEKEKFLKDHGLIVALKYSCVKCRDSGWNGSALCSCIKQRLHDEITKESGLPYPDAVFGKKAAEVFGDKIRPEMAKLYTSLEKYCASDKKEKSLLISGNTGVGKTHLLCCMANSLMNRGCTAQFLTAFSLNSIMLRYHTAPMSEKDSLLLPLLETDALFIDDLGAETILNNVTIEYLYLIINERQLNGKYIFISTNLDSDELLRRYGARIHSRLLAKSTSFFIPMPGEDLRKKR